MDEKELNKNLSKYKCLFEKSISENNLDYKKDFFDKNGNYIFPTETKFTGQNTILSNSVNNILGYYKD